VNRNGAKVDYKPIPNFMGYLQEADRWIENLMNELFEDPERAPEIRRRFREKLLESYRNGLKAAGQSPVTHEGRPPRPPSEPRRR
jgi:hypothetical protein